PLFPYTTLFRSRLVRRAHRLPAPLRRPAHRPRGRLAHGAVPLVLCGRATAPVVVVRAGRGVRRVHRRPATGLLRGGGAAARPRRPGGSRRARADLEQTRPGRLRNPRLLPAYNHPPPRGLGATVARGRPAP